MAQKQPENLNDVNIAEENTQKNSQNLQNGTDSSGSNCLGGRNPTAHIPRSNVAAQSQGAMNEKVSNIKSPSGQGGGGNGGPPNNGNDSQVHAYDGSMGHYQQPSQLPPGGGPPNSGDSSGKDDINAYGQGPPPGGVPPGPGHHPAYARYHHSDPNVDPYRYGHSPMQPVGGGKPPPGGISSPNRPPQRYLPAQSPQGPTPTLNSLLQSHPPLPQHRYSNSYDPQSQQPSSQQPQPQQQQHPPPPPSHQSYGTQQSWAPPPRPYSPQLGPSQTYRTPPPSNTSRGQSPYPPSHGQNSGSYPSSPQQPGGGPPPPPPASNQGSSATQYSPYPQRYPTPPGPPSTGPNHRSAYAAHQYTEPNRPWPGSSSPSPGPSGHPHPPASPHQTQHGGPPPSSPGHAPSPSPQPSQASPSPHQELIGQNSNDSSSGGGVSGMVSGQPGTPGTPNSQQVMRPTPSPTGSSGSRSMSPAVGQPNLPISRPSSNQSLSGSQMPPTTSVQMPHGGNLSNTPPSQQSGPGGGPSGPPNTTPNSAQQPNAPAMNSMPQQGSYQNQPPPPISHMHGYKMGPSSGQGPGPNPQNMPPYPPPPQSQQYTQGGNYPPRPQYAPGSYAPSPPSNQPTAGSQMPPGGPNQYQGRPLPNHSTGTHSQFPPYQQNWSPPNQQAHGIMGNHVQGKGTPPPPGQANVGSPRPINYLKQHLQHKGGYMAGSSPTPPQGYGNGPGMHLAMGPPHHMGPPHGPTNMGPPSALQPGGGGPSPSDGSSTPDHNSLSQDNGVSSSGSSTTSTHPVTSVITTGPDGAPLDEASQQSTLSNASAASGEDPQCTTPKSRKNDPYNQSHLAPPSTSPGGHPHSEEFEMNSPPNWSRTPASPVFNSHVPVQETFRAASKKSDSLCKLYDMDDNPDRRGWLDKLLSFMEERRTPITACPTISKQPLDLYRLYIYVKERGGFVEVTKSKTWKDIAGLLGIGASSSAAYTLRKHYTKNLLAFECHFDRGGVDPLPIIQQVEAGSKKKSTKAASVPSPAGSSNSQDSFPAPAAANAPIDGYTGYPGGGYPPGAQPDYNPPTQLQRPPSQSNAQTPHAGSPYPGQPGYSQYGSADQYNASGPPGQYSQNQSQFAPPNRTMYPPYGPENEGPPPPSSNAYGPYGNRPYTQPPTGAGQPPAPAGSAAAPPGASPVPPAGQSAYAPPPPQQDYYRPTEQNSQPRRHPDFVKDSQQYPGYNQRPQLYGGWQGSGNQYRGQYAPPPAAGQPWSGGGPRTATPPAPNQTVGVGQWDQHRYSPQSQPPYQSNQQQWGNMTSAQASQGSPLRPPPQRMPGGKPFSMPPPQQGGVGVGPNNVGGKPPQPSMQQGGNNGPYPASPAQPQQKKDLVFPSDSVEATTPVLYRRKRLTRSDVCPVDPWRIFMSLRSGLLAESSWALDLLNILLFDDTAIQYFGLSHLPGLLNLLLEHFQKNLSEMFDDVNDISVTSINSRNKSRFYENNSEEEAVDLGQVTNPPNGEERVVLLANTPNFTHVSRKGVPVRIQHAEDDIFVADHTKAWDFDSNKNYQLSATIGSEPWTYDQMEPHPYDGIIDAFKSEIVDIPFARYIAKSTKKDEDDEEEDDEEEDEDGLIGCRSKYLKRKATTNRNGINEISTKKAKASTVPEIKIEEATEASRLSPTPAAIKKENLDSDCREVDMDIEPSRVPNGTQIISDKFQLELNARLKASDDGFDPKSTVNDPATILKRRRMSDYEDECYTRDEASLYLVRECHDTLARRCICLSNIFRNLTFVPGNETILAKSSKFLALLGKLLLLNHEHLIRAPKTRNYDREEDTDFSDSCSSLQGEKEWWWEYLIHIRENMLVAVANIAGHLELSRYEEIITRPVLDGLLHWAVCPSAHGQDPFPSCGPNTSLSPQRLALEALCKLCVTDANVDLVIATPPFSRLEKLCAVLTRHLCRNEDQVLREFSVNLLHYLAAADSAMSRTVALQSPCISYLVAFIEQAEQTALGVANQHGINYLRENPDSMGTSLDMLRRAAGTLLHLSKHPDNRSLFMQQEQRLLGLVMSHILDQQVALIISRVLFQVSRGPPGPLTSLEYRLQQRQQNEKTAEQQQLQQLQKCASTNVLEDLSSSSTSDTGSLPTPAQPTASAALNFSSSNLKAHTMNSNSSCSKSDEPSNLNDISNSSTASSGSCLSTIGSSTNIENLCGNNKSNISTTTATITGNNSSSSSGSNSSSNNSSSNSMNATTAAVA